ncbi:MAG: hypothetical protein ACYC9Q_12445 [Bacillota bacterium]
MWGGPPTIDRDLAAIMYDYHLVGVGLPWGDCRNVAGSLDEPARTAFWEAYGPGGKRRRRLDEPTSILCGLLAALRLPKLPRWGEVCLEEALGCRLEQTLGRAVASIDTR